MGQSPIYIVNTVVLTRFLCKRPTFSHSYRARNIFARFIRKSPTFGHSYSARNILAGLVCENPLYRNVLLSDIPIKLEIFWQYLYTQKSPAFVYSYSSSRNLLIRFVHKSPSLVNPKVVEIV